jgi:hypothetical protein
MEVSKKLCNNLDTFQKGHVGGGKGIKAEGLPHRYQITIKHRLSYPATQKSLWLPKRRRAPKVLFAFF